MTDTVISDALAWPQDRGIPGIGEGEETWNSAGFKMLMGRAGPGGYVMSEDELGFANHDDGSNEVDVTPGVAYVSVSDVDVQSALGGSVPPDHDVELPSPGSLVVIIPETVTVPLQDDTLSTVWLAFATDDAVSSVDAGDVYLRSDDDGSVTEPPHPHIELGAANPADPGEDVLTNRGLGVTVDTGTMLTGGGQINLGESRTIQHADTSSQDDVSAGDGEAITSVELDSRGHVTDLGVDEVVPDSTQSASIPTGYAFEFTQTSGAGWYSQDVEYVVCDGFRWEGLNDSGNDHTHEVEVEFADGSTEDFSEELSGNESYDEEVNFEPGVVSEFRVRISTGVGDSHSTVEMHVMALPEHTHDIQP